MPRKSLRRTEERNLVVSVDAGGSMRALGSLLKTAVVAPITGPSVRGSNGSRLVRPNVAFAVMASLDTGKNVTTRMKSPMMVVIVVNEPFRRLCWTRAMACGYAVVVLKATCAIRRR